MGFSSALRRRRHKTHHRTICSRYGLSAPGTTARHVRGTSRTGEIRTHGGLLLGRVQAGSLKPLGHRSIVTERAGFEPAGAFTPRAFQTRTIDRSDIFPYTEGEGFEPPDAFASPVFEAGTIGHSVNLPVLFTVLQRVELCTEA